MGPTKASAHDWPLSSRDYPTVIPFGYTDQVPALMAASDVVVTSSGDTCREARVIGRRMVLLDVVPGHGRENLMHEFELGDAAVCLPTPASVVGNVRRFLRRPRIGNRRGQRLAGATISSMS